MLSRIPIVACPFTVLFQLFGCLSIFSFFSRPPHRHPENNQRPTFKDILAILAEDPDSLLHWSEADKAVHPFSFVLGSELEEGQDLYPQLQQTFVKSKLKV